MKLEMAQILLNKLSCNIGKCTGNGQIVEKLMIVPSDEEMQKQYLQLYKLNKCTDGGMLEDCYSNEDLTIIFVIESQFPKLTYQDIRQFALKEVETISYT
jgi:hypothetical protein